MKPIDFAGRNIIMGAGQKAYAQLPARRRPDGVVVSCWKPTLAERLHLVFGGAVWFHQHTFNQPMQPVFLTTDGTIEMPGQG